MIVRRGSGGPPADPPIILMIAWFFLHSADHDCQQKLLQQKQRGNAPVKQRHHVTGAGDGPVHRQQSLEVLERGGRHQRIDRREFVAGLHLGEAEKKLLAEIRPPGNVITMRQICSRQLPQPANRMFGRSC